MERILFESKLDFEKFFEENKERLIFNFLNQHDLYMFNEEKLFRESFSNKHNLNFIDGFLISIFLSFKHLRKIKRIRGPFFTRNFFGNENFNKNKKHFFIGIEEHDLDNFSYIFPYLKKKNLSAYNPPYIKTIKFSEKEIIKILKLINNFKPDYVWVCIGSPKQNILSVDLFKKTKAKYFFNVGAALDFILEKKKEAPKFVRMIGLEWFYRFITDFKYSKKKVWRSLISLKYLMQTNLKEQCQ